MFYVCQKPIEQFSRMLIGSRILIISEEYEWQMTRPASTFTLIVFMFFVIVSPAVTVNSLETAAGPVQQIKLESGVQPAYEINDTLEITVTPSKSLYNVGDELKINGTLLLIHDNQSFPIQGQLIALQINDRASNYAYRTVETAPGASPSQWQITISRAYIGDANGNLLTFVTKGQIVYTWLTYYNNWNHPLHVAVAYTVVDANNVHLWASNPIAWDLLPGFNYTVRDTWKVPSYAATGSAQLLASAFSDLPSSGGYPYCPETSSTFTVASSGYLTSATSEAGTYVAYVKTSKKADPNIPSGTRIGTYTVYVAAKYGDVLRANASTTFQITLAGDVDGVKNPSTGIYSVNILDAIKLAQAFGSQPGYPNWNPKADFNGDDKVNILDCIVLSANFGNQAL